MLVCHCNILTERDIETAIRRLLEADPWQLLVPAKVYHSLGRRGRCCGCFGDVAAIIVRVTEAFHAEWAGAGGDGTANPPGDARDDERSPAPAKPRKAQ